MAKNEIVRGRREVFKYEGKPMEFVMHCDNTVWCVYADMQIHITQDYFRLGNGKFKYGDERMFPAKRSTIQLVKACGARNIMKYTGARGKHRPYKVGARGTPLVKIGSMIKLIMNPPQASRKIAKAEDFVAFLQLVEESMIEKRAYKHPPKEEPAVKSGQIVVEDLKKSPVQLTIDDIDRTRTVTSTDNSNEGRLHVTLRADNIAAAPAKKRGITARVKQLEAEAKIFIRVMDDYETFVRKGWWGRLFHKWGDK